MNRINKVEIAKLINVWAQAKFLDCTFRTYKKNIIC